MRLHTLEVSAFGPFADTIEVDFDELGADGLFLLHGQTGAGKTSILDAVAFALYGTVPGARKEAKRLLSDHAVPGAVPTVRLVATLGGRRITLVRSPEFMRLNKKTGVGTTKQNAKASLTWMDGQSENLTRLDEIGVEIERLLGMKADQFFQVVLLPQGEFAKFLRAKTDERGVLLEKLFDTARFFKVEEWFLDRKRASERKLAASSESVERLAAQVSTAAGVEPYMDVDPAQWAQDVFAGARDTAHSAMRAHSETKEGHDRATVALTHALAVGERRARGEAARARLTELAESDAERALWSVERDRASRAVLVSERSRDLDIAKASLSAAVASMASAEKALAASPEGRALIDGLSWPPATDDETVLERFVREWTQESARLERIEALIATVGKLDSAQLVDRAAAETVDAEAVALDAALAEIPASVTGLDEQRTAAVTAQASLGSAGERRTRAAAAVAAALEHASATAKFSTAVDARDRAHHQWNDARQAWLDTRERRLGGMAAELAATLTDGEACVVCGSCAHPDPAHNDLPVVTADDEDAALHVAEQAEARHAKAVEACVEVRRTLDDLVVRGGDRDRVELDAELALASDDENRLRSIAATLVGVDRARADLERRADELRLRRESLSSRRATLAERIAATSVTVNEMRAEISRAAPDGSAATHRRRLDGAVAAASALRTTRADAVGASRRVQECADKVDAAVVAAEFVDVDDAVESIRDKRRIDEITTALSAAENTRSVAHGVLAEPAVRDALDGAPVDSEPLRIALAEADQANAAALRIAAEADLRVRSLEDIVTQLWSAAEHLAPAREKHRELEELADVVAGRGQNARRMSLRSYVLAARLEEVAIAASARLRRMTNGRFEFVHSDDAGPRGTRGGLGLEVRDDYTGVVRSAGTLSGGESFCASLSLALGLADVVAAEAGGITLDTIFIDEGFGSLDAGSLDSVMGVLDELRSGGRTVGIVSHVDEIRDRVPSRLHVIRGRRGSTVQAHVGV